MSPLRKSILAASTQDLQFSEEGIMTRTFVFGTDFLGFQGHFPEAPVVPAIAQIMAAQTMIEESAGKSLQLSSVTNAKYMDKLGPDEVIVVTCQQRTKDEMIQYQVTVSKNDKKASSFNLSFQ